RAGPSTGSGTFVITFDLLLSSFVPRLHHL
ncbi:MAG: hypothetical protein ACI8U0_002840, partial [Flavobacteriales bacterium]